MIELHYCAAPNPQKVSIMLEELGLPYRLHFYSAVRGEHLTPEYFRINPNRKLPALVDNAPVGDDKPLVIFESGAILIYLAEKSGRFLPSAPKARYAAMQWLMFQMSAIGPMHGQAVHFRRYAAPVVDSDLSYPIDRYDREIIRLLAVMDHRLGETEYLAGDYSIADMACFPWIALSVGLLGTDLSPFPALERWKDSISSRPAVQRGTSITDPTVDLTKVETRLTPEEWSNLFGDRQHDIKVAAG